MRLSPAIPLILLLFPAHLSGRLHAQALSPTEQKIVKTVDQQNAQALDLLRTLVDINSGTMNLDGVRAVGKVLTPQFEALGFSVRWAPMEAVHRAGHLVADHPCPAGAACGKKMLLIGHMDTVFDKDSPFQTYTAKGNIGIGPGVNDMKGGLVMMLYALKAMQAAGALQHADITLVLSGDEENPGEPTAISRKDMIDAARKSQVALEFEGTATEGGLALREPAGTSVPSAPLKFYGSTARRSAIPWRIDATGKSGHSSGIFSESVGYGAVFELARILDAFRTQLPEPSLTYSVGLVLGGTAAKMAADGTRGEAAGKDNIIPPVAIAVGDLRTLSNEQTARVEAKMRSIVAAHLPRTDSSIQFSGGYPAMPPTEGNRSLLRMLNGVNRSLGEPGMPELDPLQRGAGDISFAAPYTDGLAGVGASGKGAHAPGETIDLPAQPLNTKRVALLMYRLTQLDPAKKLTELFPAEKQ